MADAMTACHVGLGGEETFARRTARNSAIMEKAMTNRHRRENIRGVIIVSSFL